MAVEARTLTFHPFFYLLLTITEASPGGGAVEAISILAGAGVILFAFYKLGTVESLIKTLLAVIIGLVGAYAAGYLEPGLRDAGWYQLVAWIVEESPDMILHYIRGGNKT
jgi:hypothetical protein